MAVPRNRHSNARKNKRRSHLAKELKNIVKCSNCNAAILPHRICETCGFYNKKQVINAE
jgi:large subunit ribosomal protein L32